MSALMMTMRLTCTVEQDEGTSVYVSHCPTLDVYSQGSTEKEAIEAVKDAVTLYLSTAYDYSRLDQVLRQAGFLQLTGNIPVEEVPSKGEFVRVEPVETDRSFAIDIPLALLAQGHASTRTYPS